MPRIDFIDKQEIKKFEKIPTLNTQQSEFFFHLPIRLYFNSFFLDIVIF